MTLLPESVAMVELAASYVAGKWVSDAHAGTLALAPPRTGGLLGPVGVARGGEVASAVAAARGALPGWGRVPPADRGAALGRLADALNARQGELADLTTAENRSTP